MEKEMKCQVPMNDEGLAHMCKLSVISIDMIENPTFVPSECADEIGDQDFGNMLSILARTAQELMRRNGIKPVFRTTAQTEPA